MKIIKKKYCVLYFVCVFLLILLNSCVVEEFDPMCACGPSPYEGDLAIKLREIKDSRVKSIKVTLKNLDGIAPEYDVYKKREGYLKKKAGNIHYNRAKKR